jgi:hypothetical protein
MSWIDRVNRYFLNAIAKQRASSAQVGQTMLPMSPALIGQLARLDLVSHQGFIGETLTLYGTLTNGTLTAISEADPGWAGVRTALDQSGRLPVALHIADLRLLADPDRKSLCLMDDASDRKFERATRFVAPKTF